MKKLLKVRKRTFKEWWENVHKNIQTNTAWKFNNPMKYKKISIENINNILLILHDAKRDDLKPSISEFKEWLNSGQLRDI